MPVGGMMPGNLRLWKLAYLVIASDDFSQSIFKEFNLVEFIWASVGLPSGKQSVLGYLGGHVLLVRGGVLGEGVYFKIIVIPETHEFI